VQDPVAAGTAIAGNMDEAVTDIRDAAPDDVHPKSLWFRFEVQRFRIYGSRFRV
jgi:hypothetical protein